MPEKGGTDAVVGFEAAGLRNVEVFQVEGQPPEAVVVHDASGG